MRGVWISIRSEISAATRHPVAVWTIRGTLFGMLFPAASMLFVIMAESPHLGIVDLHWAYPLLFVIDLAPLVLGASGWLIGRLVMRLQKAAADQRELAEHLSHTWEHDIANHAEEVTSLAHVGIERAAAVSHELRTPLTAMLGFVDLLLADAGNETPESVEYLTEIKASGEFMLELVNEFLDRESNVAELFEVHNAPVDASAVAAAVVRHLAPMALQRGLTLTFQDGLTGPVVADSKRLRQVLTNLVVNSIRYTPTGSVAVRTRDVEGRALITVEDTGVGMTDEELERLFQPYERGVTLNETGTGLGLGLARSMVEAMQGTLTASSPGRSRGSTMTIVLPQAQASSLAS